MSDWYEEMEQAKQEYDIRIEDEAFEYNNGTDNTREN